MVPAPRTLRPYQIEAHDAVISEWACDTRRTAVVLPTGAGKSSVIAKLAHTSVALGMKPLLVAHRSELIDQLAENCQAVDPTAAPVGVVQAGRNEPHADIVVATLQTLTAKGRIKALLDRNVILFDEVHHATAETYLAAMRALGVGEDAFFCGFTATLRRSDGKALREVIDSVAYEKDLRWAIEEKFLVRPRGLTVKIPELDLNKVKVTAGDFQNNELAEVMEAATETVVDAIMRFAGDRRPMVFAASVLSAQKIAEALTDRGMRAAAVTGEMSREARKVIYDGYRSGQLQAMVTVQVLTEGADFPMCDTAVIARPTQSQVLYSQMVGRALRLHEGKEDALVLDLVGTSRVMRLVTLTDLDAGTHSKTVDPDGNELDDEDYDDLPMGDTPAPKQIRMGVVDMVEIDLLGSNSTEVLWLQTIDGTPFIPVQDLGEFVFLWETGYDAHQPLYKVGTITSKGPRKGHWVDERMWPADVARHIAEDYIIEQGAMYPRRSQSWHRTNQPPSDAQLRFARTLGIPDSEMKTKGRLSDDINIALASSRIAARR